MATTTTSNSPWGGQEPYLHNVFREAEDLAGTPRSFYGGPTVAGYNPVAELGMGMSMQHALGGSPYEYMLQNMLTQNMGQGQFNLGGAGQAAQSLMGGAGAGQSALQSLAGGGPNPHLDRMYGAASDAMSRQYQNTVMPGINATFGAGGRTGSAAHTNALGQAQQGLGNQLGNLSANMYGGAYDADQSRRLSAGQSLQSGALGGGGLLGDLYGRVNSSQLGAAQLAPSAYNMETGRLDRLGAIGQGITDQSQSMIDADRERFEYYRDTPYDNLSWLGNMVGGRDYGGVQRQYTPRNAAGEYLGYGLAGAGILSSLIRGGR